MRVSLSEKRRGIGVPPSSGPFHKESKGTSLELLSSPLLERIRGRRRIPYLQFLPTSSVTVVDPHRHCQIGRVDKGDALILAVPPHCTNSWICRHLLIRVTSLPHSLCQGRGMDATPPQEPDLSRRQKDPMSWPHSWNTQVKGTLWQAIIGTIKEPSEGPTSDSLK